jgi:acyl-CoA synthetase (AMP-forming)/AMP-acid ligase II
MAQVETLRTSPATGERLNVTDRLTKFAESMPDAIAVACPPPQLGDRHVVKRGKTGAKYSTITFAELEADVERIVRGLATWCVPPGTRLALLVKPGIEFVTLVFALLRAGMVIVLVDPGLGRRNMIRCLSEAEPEGFVAISRAQAVRTLMRRKFPRARWNVTVGRRLFWGGKTLDQLRDEPNNPQSEIRNPKSTQPDDAAAIIFTSGSTGPPKGVLYTHRMFDTQVAEIQSEYNIEPGGIDLACFPLFALFNAAMGVKTVMPEMDFSRPASADPKKLLAAANDWQVTQAFASPAVWRVLSDHCVKSGDRIDSLRQVFSCGAPVPASVLRKTLACVGKDAKMYTPYGATECLPVSTIEAAEVLGETTAATDNGTGVCVGRKFDSIEWQVIRISDEPIATMDDAVELPIGQIGELVVRGPQISPAYVTGTKANPVSKILDGNQTWHRTGDVGYFDEQGRFWYCGRKSQRVETQNGILFTECVEAIFNTHPFVSRTALVGVELCGRREPVLVYEPKFLRANPPIQYNNIPRELRGRAITHNMTKDIQVFLPRWRLPVDIRHNAKINREQIALWAAKKLAKSSGQRPVCNS